MKIKMKMVLGILLSLVLVMGVMPGMNLTAYAAEASETFTTNLQQAEYTGTHFTISCDYSGDGKGFYLNPSYTATISAQNGEIITKVEFTCGAYNISRLQSATGNVTYSGVVGTVSNVNATSLTVNTKPESGPLQIKAVKVYYIAHNVTITGGANATTSGGATSQTGLTGAMTTVTYTANTRYYFAEFADISSNGITAKRTSSTVVTVSGTPTSDATITVPDAVEKTAATVTKAPTAKSLTYTGQAQGLVNAGEAENGTMQYALGKDATTAPTDGWGTSIPTATDAGT